MNNIPQPENLAKSTPPPISKKLTHTIIAACAAVFLLMVYKESGAFTSPSIDILFGFGANSAPETMTAEPWRLLTYMFVHIGIIHLAFNMYILNNLGPIVNEFYGRKRFILIYLLAGIGSGIASAWWKPNVLSAGASGAIFGLVGCLIAYFLVHRKSYDSAIISGNVKSLLGFVAFNVYFGFVTPGIDNAAHLGGLCFGFLFGFLLCPRPAWELKWGWKNTATTFLLLIILAGAGMLARDRVLTFIEVRNQVLEEYKIKLLEYQQQQKLKKLILPIIQEIIKHDKTPGKKVIRLHIPSKGAVIPQQPADENVAPEQVDKNVEHEEISDEAEIF